jgi:aerobic-type carbon monoxide dehydrogenase small subunit (CoxS/CutS family)
MAIRMKVNGEERVFEIDPDTPLLWALRDDLGLIGTKFGCGVNRCGACTVHVDGRARRSCILPISRLEGREITTIEGLSTDGTHPVQRAWEKINVPQCGYCQAGQIMSASALLAETPQPTDEDIDGALQVNICRCGTYQRVRLAIHEAAAELAGEGDGDAR